MLLFLVHMAVVVPAAAWRAYVAGVLWVWFVTPVFHVPVPSLWVLAGLSVFVAMFHSWNIKTVTGEIENKDVRAFVEISLTFFIPGLALFVGWIFRLLAGSM